MPRATRATKLPPRTRKYELYLKLDRARQRTHMQYLRVHMQVRVGVAIKTPWRRKCDLAAYRQVARWRHTQSTTGTSRQKSANNTQTELQSIVPYRSISSVVLRQKPCAAEAKPPKSKPIGASGTSRSHVGTSQVEQSPSLSPLNGLRHTRCPQACARRCELRHATA